MKYHRLGHIKPIKTLKQGDIVCSGDVVGENSTVSFGIWFYWKGAICLMTPMCLWACGSNSFVSFDTIAPNVGYPLCGSISRPARTIPIGIISWRAVALYNLTPDIPRTLVYFLPPDGMGGTTVERPTLVLLAHIILRISLRVKNIPVHFPTGEYSW